MPKMINKLNLILGSQSPRRKELLQWSYWPFDIVTSDVEEKSSHTEVDKLVMDLAIQKAQDVYKKVKDKYKNPIVLGADTIVVVDDKVLGKPKSRDEAQSMLENLSGKEHQVLTGVCLNSSFGQKSFYDLTQVVFEKIDPNLLQSYLETEESMDKAGAYGIQGAALGFIKEIKGSYSNVVGLPLNLVINKMYEFLTDHEQVQLPNKWGDIFE